MYWKYLNLYVNGTPENSCNIMTLDFVCWDLCPYKSMFTDLFTVCFKQLKKCGDKIQKIAVCS